MHVCGEWVGGVGGVGVCEWVGGCADILSSMVMTIIHSR